MTRIEYPHPVLCADNDDYAEGTSFSMVIYDERGKVNCDDIELPIECELSCNGLEDLLSRGMAKLCVIAHSPATSYRSVGYFLDGSTQTKMTIHKYAVSGKIELQCMLIAAEPCPSFSIPDFNQDFFAGLSFSIAPNDILAMTEKTIIYLDDSDFEKPLSSIFNVNLSLEMEDQVSIDCCNRKTGKIEIYLNQQSHSAYSQLASGYKSFSQGLLSATVCLPALIEALDAIKQNGAEEYADLRWYRTVEKKLEELGLEIVDSDKTSVTLANELLGEVILRSMNDFTKSLEESQEYDHLGGAD